MHIQHFPHLITAFILGTPGVFLLTSSPIFAAPIDRLVAPEPLNTLAEKPFAQVNSVSQLSDVKPTDWAFQALQSLVERYGCIAGYPDGTYRGNRAMTRYEFAAGLNSCLDRVSELIAAGTTNLITGEDLAIVQKLQAEFATELSVLRGRVDTLDARTAQLEANQFSTTTKLNAEIIVVVYRYLGQPCWGFARSHQHYCCQPGPIKFGNQLHRSRYAENPFGIRQLGQPCRRDGYKYDGLEL